MNTQKVELENSMIRDWPRQQWQYVAPTLNRCGCEVNEVKYWVDGDQQCTSCMMQAIDCDEYVRVRKI